ncbi:MAG: DUF2807 domain-containing protein [Gammaproteobacteria bacterium]
MFHKYIFLFLLSIIYQPITAFSADSGQTLNHYHEAPQAQALSIEDFSGELLITSQPEPGIRLKLTGSKRQLDDQDITTRNGVLHLRMQQSHSARRSTRINTLTNTSVMAFASNGSTTHLIINGQAITPDSSNRSDNPDQETAAEPLSAELMLPANLPLTITGLRGQARIGPRSGPVDATLAAGTMDFAALHDARLRVTGSGNIGVDTAQGQLDITIKGSGNIQVADARLSLLEAQLKGVGSIHIKGQAEQAELRLRGAGSIYVDSVLQQPRTSLSGVGSITVGNW